MRTRAALVLALCALLATGGSAHAAEAPAEIVADAWYQSPAGVSGAPVDNASTYPEGTLHVGVVGGTEQARSYLEIDLTALPRGADLLGGTMRLPVLGSDSGTASFESARVRACLAPGEIEEVAGSAATPPAIDCDVSAAAVSTGSAEQPVLEIDLAPFVGRWTAGPAALAIVPAASALTPPTTWHVAFPARSSTAPLAVTATLSYREDIAARPSPSAVSPPATSTGSITTGGPGRDVAPVLLDDVTSGLAASGAELAVAADSTAAARPVSIVTFPFSHREVFLLPFALLGLAVVLGRVFTAPFESDSR